MSMSVSGVGGAGTPNAVSGASASMPPQQKMTNLYNQIDTTGSGAITQSQFNQAFNGSTTPAAFQSAGSSSVWNALDPNRTGQVSQQDFVNGMKSMMHTLRQGDSGAAQTSAAATQGLSGISA